MGNDHLNDALVAFALYLLASGANLAYGGIPQLTAGGNATPAPNFLDLLLDLVMAYARLAGDLPGGGLAEELAGPRLSGYIAAPYRAMVDSADFKSKWRWAFKVNKPEPAIPPPAPDASDSEKAYFTARSLTAMRAALADDVDSQVLIGGKIFGASGAYPGIVEECYLTLRADKAVYVIGGFGGAAGVLAEALLGDRPGALTRAAHERDTRYAQLAAAYDRAVAGRAGEPIDFERVVGFLNQTGVAGLSSRNGLTEDENRRLFVTSHVPEMVYLVLKGMARVAARR
jgi:hypothetical protein